jgi:hypothetical protein
MKNLYKKIQFTLIIFYFILTSLFINTINAQQADVVINAIVQPCSLELFFEPSNRIPNNLSTQVNINIKFLDNTDFHIYTLTTNSIGGGLYNFCSNNIYPATGVYNLHVKGISHLRRVISSQSLFTNVTTVKDYRQNEFLLIAGETSNTFDNKINSLDISTQIGKLNTVDYVNDLNQDGIVNEADLVITRNNFFKIGD